MCVCARACACVRLCVSATVHVCVCLCAHVCARCVPVHLLLHACIPVNFSSCITTECQCSANCTILWGQTKVCESLFLPLAQPDPLLPAAGGQGLGGKVQAERGGASSPLVTLNKNFRFRPP